jgi:hypothetical protein
MIPSTGGLSSLSQREGLAKIMDEGPRIHRRLRAGSVARAEDNLRFREELLLHPELLSECPL